MPKNFDAAKNAECIRTTSCSKCKAVPGYKCTTYNGRIMGFVHAERMAQFNADEKAKADAAEAARGFGEASRMADKIVEQVTVVSNHNTTSNPVVAPHGAFVEGMLGRTIEEAERRSNTIQSIEGGIRLLIGLEGLDWTIRRLAEMIVDGQLETFKR